MNRNPTTTLKWAAAACAVFWSAGMIWWMRSYDPVAMVIFSVGGAVFGLCWYLAMRFSLVALRTLPRTGENTDDVPLGKFFRWMVWAASMVLSGITTAALLDYINPLLPAGDLHWMARSLFIIIVWPALMWSLHAFLKRHLPA